MIHCINHIIDRNHVQTTTFKSKSWHPARHKATHFLNQFEEIIGAVDLINFTGFRMSQNHARTINSERNFTFTSNHTFRVMFGTKIGMLETGCFIKHIFTENTVIKTGSCNRRNMMKAFCINFISESNGISGAFDISNLLLLIRGFHIINGSQMEKVLNLAFKLVFIFFTDTQTLFTDITGNGNHSVFWSINSFH